ncbi:MAG: hypothetical protein AMQ74_01621 [Candidatus Methanofastidiosum methylothiophilum]|uniref:Uncharacterized protein n=1 Tax=Candidatus Methanofastidiosum methylothiophilum TaxID=1705564 RepID=A0A150IT53_9EURY|nr:MAG: hypothetical protein AMQ74_01621 [Candidatus Methanofastidiosum methylthiophilus]
MKTVVLDIGLLILLVVGAIGTGINIGMVYQRSHDIQVIEQQQQAIEKANLAISVCNSIIPIYKADILACGCSPSVVVSGFTGEVAYTTKGVDTNATDSD